MDVRRHSRNAAGFSLLELLICVAIIGILMAMYMVTFSKVHRHVKTETARATMVQTAGVSDALMDKHPSILDCRREFFQPIGKNEIMCMMYYRVTSDAEFTAYWNSLLNPNSDVEPYVEDNKLVVTHPSGKTFMLKRQTIAWTFIAYKEGVSNSVPLGADFLNPFTNEFEYAAYPTQFPATPTVAALSYQFLEDFDMVDEY